MKWDQSLGQEGGKEVLVDPTHDGHEAIVSETGLPTQIPLRFEAAILSRTSSPMTSCSNCANDKRTLRVSLPMLVVVLKEWVVETNETECWSNSSTSLAKTASERVS